MKYLLQFLATAFVIMIISQNIPGITLENGYTSALIFAVILAIVNLFLGTILRIITLPIRFITLGAFSFVILLLIVRVADELVPGVVISGFVPYALIAFASSVISIIFKFFR
ncbi:phage holin family protein [Candidatus Gracilibacteria bacterium]|nr:phage holin family protein [Candidatus Gracilibacteria bacterium]